MPGLLVAPYNDSMRLGQGFNSFLQLPCVDNAVSFDPSKVIVERSKAGAGGVSQVVSYSSRFVEKISDVVKSMNISAGSSIKSGSIEIGGNSSSVDEAKFSTSDLNAVVSVKVTNQTTRLVDVANFKPLENITFDNAKFFDIYGDCYVSGFIEGGDLHGIVSIKVLDASTKTDVERAIKGQMNGTSSTPPKEFNFGEGSAASSFSAALSQTETTITVNWSGGGQIKPDDEDWTLDSLMKAAAAFPAKVAACPQRTWAILTKYDNNRDFVEWAEAHKIAVPQYQGANAYTSDLLDNFMEYKNLINRIQAILANPLGFVISPVANAIRISVAELVEERKKMKKEMNEIVSIIDEICLEPGKVKKFEEHFVFTAPEIWATRLPIAKAVAEESGSMSIEQAQKELAAFSFVAQTAPSSHKQAEAAVQAALDDSMKSITDSTVAAAETMHVTETPSVEDSLKPLCSDETLERLSEWEKNSIATEKAKEELKGYWFTQPCAVKDVGGPFNDAVEMVQSMVPVIGPRRLEFHLVRWGIEPVVGWIKVHNDQMTFTHGNDRGTSLGSMSLNLEQGEHVTRIRMCSGSMVWGSEGLVFIEVQTNTGKVERLGSEKDNVIESTGSGTFVAFKGFYGAQGDIIDRLGAIWG